MTVIDRETQPRGPALEVPIVDSPPDDQPVGWHHRHLLDVDALSWADIELVMRTTDAMREVLGRPIAKVPALRGRNVTILFYEASTRTRVSFEVAAKNLSADVVNIAAATSSVTKGESLVDTIRTVEALGAQMLVMRHGVSGAPYLAAETFGFPRRVDVLEWTPMSDGSPTSHMSCVRTPFRLPSFLALASGLLALARARSWTSGGSRSGA